MTSDQNTIRIAGARDGEQPSLEARLPRCSPDRRRPRGRRARGSMRSARFAWAISAGRRGSLPLGLRLQEGNGRVAMDRVERVACCDPGRAAPGAPPRMSLRCHDRVAHHRAARARRGCAPDAEGASGPFEELDRPATSRSTDVIVPGPARQRNADPGASGPSSSAVEISGFHLGHSPIVDMTAPDDGCRSLDSDFADADHGCVRVDRHPDVLSLRGCQARSAAHAGSGPGHDQQVRGPGSPSEQADFGHAP